MKKESVKQKATRAKKTQTKEGTANDKNNGSGPSLLEKFFTDQLKDIYYAEHKISESLPKMRDAASSESLKSAFEDHLHQTEGHIRRLDQVFQLMKQR